HRARIDALLATSPRAAELAQALYPGDYETLPDPVSELFQPGPKDGTQLVAEWTADSRGVSKALIRLIADNPKLELTLVWDRRARRPLRPYIPAAARGRVQPLGPEDEQGRAMLLSQADVLITAVDGDPRLAWEARAAGCVVVSAVGDGPGLRYAPDQPPLASAAAARLLEDDALRGRLAAVMVSAAGERGSETVAERLEQIYLGLLRRRRERPHVAPRPELIDVDLHMHTSHSHDCATDPAALLDHCIAQGLSAVAITDH